MMQIREMLHQFCAVTFKYLAGR